jgi:hypothetical protein
VASGAKVPGGLGSADHPSQNGPKIGVENFIGYGFERDNGIDFNADENGSLTQLRGLLLKSGSRTRKLQENRSVA